MNWFHDLSVCLGCSCTSFCFVLHLHSLFFTLVWSFDLFPWHSFHHSYLFCFTSFYFLPPVFVVSCFLGLKFSYRLKLLLMHILCSTILYKLLYCNVCLHSAGSIMICWCGSPHLPLNPLLRSLAAPCSSADPKTTSFSSANLPSDLVSHLKTHEDRLL